MKKGSGGESLNHTEPGSWMELSSQIYVSAPLLVGKEFPILLRYEAGYN
jgi:hypothetical protein